MNPKKALSAWLLSLFFMSVFSQEPKVKIRVVDTDQVSTIVEAVSTSSSSSCMTADFPVYQGESSKEVNFSDLKKIIVRHDKPAEDGMHYISVELITKDGESGLYEMINNIRITGKSEKGDFSVMVKDVQTVEVIDGD
jgi:hypothetical protein